MNAQDYFVDLARYQRWANRVLTTTIDSLPPEALARNEGLFFGSIHHTYDHLVQVQTLWAARLRGEVCKADFKRIHELDWGRLKAHAQASLESFEAWLGARPPAWFDDETAFTSSDGTARRMGNVAILTHMNGHWLHHRGQISAVLTRLGAAAPEMDYFYYRRELAAT